MAQQFDLTQLFTDPALISYYKAEDTSDSKGSNTLVNHNSTTFTAGLFNNAATFNGSTQGLQLVSTNPFVTGNVDVGFSFWLKISTQPSNSTIRPFVWGNANHAIFFQYVDTSGTKSLEIIDGNTMDVSVNTALVTGTYYNIILSYASSTQVWTVFLSAIPILTGISNSPASNISSFSLGYSQITNNDFLTGQIDDIPVFSRQLVQSDANIINGITTSSLLISDI